MLKAKQIKFCLEYIKDLNATQAAIRAGYSVKTAYAIGCENLKKPNIKAHIKELMEEKTIGPEETIKLISDISKSSLNDYMMVKTVVHTPLVRKSLKKIIKELEDKFLFEEEFAARAGLSEEQLQHHQKSQAELDLRIFRYKMELEKNPRATKIVEGEQELLEVAELDMAKLAKDKDAGRIKTFKSGSNGVTVELYAADQALRDMLKVHNLVNNKVEISGSLDFAGFLMANSVIDEEGGE